MTAEDISAQLPSLATTPSQMAMNGSVAVSRPTCTFVTRLQLSQNLEKGALPKQLRMSQGHRPVACPSVYCYLLGLQPNRRTHYLLGKVTTHSRYLLYPGNGEASDLMLYTQSVPSTAPFAPMV